jgi:hypothetical protein
VLVELAAFYASSQRQGFWLIRFSQFYFL